MKQTMKGWWQAFFIEINYDILLFAHERERDKGAQDLYIYSIYVPGTMYLSTSYVELSVEPI